MQMMLSSLRLDRDDKQQVLFFIHQGRALLYTVSTSRSDANIGYFDLLERLSRQLYKPILPEENHLRLQSASQKHWESVEEWADRLESLVRKAAKIKFAIKTMLKMVVTQFVFLKIIDI